MNLKEHNIILRGERIVLRPMTENDWGDLLRWNCDPEVLYFSDGNDVTSYTLKEVQDIYRSVSQSAFCFMIEYGGKAVGECWLQKMNLERLLMQFRDSDVRRIDIMIGEKDCWNLGIGTEAVGLLTSMGFEAENADVIFGCDILDYNPRSRRAFEKNGYVLFDEVPLEPGSRTNALWDMYITREAYSSRPLDII